MTGATQVLTMVYQHIQSSPLASAITGRVEKGARPLNSEEEDICINSLPLTSGQLQKCIVNVNVFVPDIVVDSEEGNETVANYARLEELETLALNVLDNVYNGYWFDVQQAVIYSDNESKSHYLNIRIDFKITNLN